MSVSKTCIYIHSLLHLECHFSNHCLSQIYMNIWIDIYTYISVSKTCIYIYSLLHLECHFSNLCLHQTYMNIWIDIYTYISVSKTCIYIYSLLHLECHFSNLCLHQMYMNICLYVRHVYIYIYIIYICIINIIYMNTILQSIAFGVSFLKSQYSIDYRVFYVSFATFCWKELKQTSWIAIGALDWI